MLIFGGVSHKSNQKSKVSPVSPPWGSQTVTCSAFRRPSCPAKIRRPNLRVILIEKAGKGQTDIAATVFYTLC